MDAYLPPLQSLSLSLSVSLSLSLSLSLTLQDFHPNQAAKTEAEATAANKVT